VEILATQVGRFVCLGSNAEYGAAPCPQSPDGPTFPNSAYGVTKLAATALVLAKAVSKDLPATVVRPFLVYGAGQSPRSFLAAALQAARAGREFPTSPGGQTRDFVFVEEVVTDLLEIARDAATLGRCVNSCSGQERSLRSVLELMQELYPTFHPVFGAVPYRPTELMRSCGVPYRLSAKAAGETALRRFLASGGTA